MGAVHSIEDLMPWRFSQPSSLAAQGHAVALTVDRLHQTPQDVGRLDPGFWRREACGQVPDLAAIDLRHGLMQDRGGASASARKASSPDYAPRLTVHDAVALRGEMEST